MLDLPKIRLENFEKVREQYGRETVELRPLNPLYPTLSSQELQLQLCGVVVECRKRFR